MFLFLGGLGPWVWGLKASRGVSVTLMSLGPTLKGTYLLNLSAEHFNSTLNPQTLTQLQRVLACYRILEYIRVY